MKKYLHITVFLLSFVMNAQVETIKITDLELPNAPAFTILDYSPTIISNPKTTQELTASLINSVNSANGIPANYALEFTPYWTFSGDNKSLRSYLDGETKNLIFKPYKNLSISLASVKKDSIQNISLGIRTNILTINNKDITALIMSINTDLIEINKIIDGTLSIVDNPFASGTEEAKQWDKDHLNALSLDKEYKKLTKKVYDNVEAIKKLKAKPVLSIDVAGAYNHFFDNEEYKSGKFGRIGAWTTINENISITKNVKNYLCLYQYARFLADETNYDTTTLSYERKESLDIGAKVEFQLNNLSIGYEYVLRTSEKDNYRSVGNIKYKVNDNIIINGGFGKNFEKTDNLISFFGVSWGISQNNDVKVK